MANNKGAVIFLAIIAVAGLGLSGYMFVSDLLSENDTQQNFKLVGLWNELDDNQDTPPHTTFDDFLIEYTDQMVLDSSYVNIVNETRFTLPMAGLYKINMNVLSNNLVSDKTYWVELLRNGSIFEYLDYFKTANPAVHTYHFTKTSVYINSTGGDTYYELRGHGTGTFGVYGSSNYNQLSIEYIIV